jgi:hypothetical protein
MKNQEIPDELMADINIESDSPKPLVVNFIETPSGDEIRLRGTNARTTAGNDVLDVDR